MRNQLKDRVVFITSASGGIGWACAVEYHRGRKVNTVVQFVDARTYGLAASCAIAKTPPAYTAVGAGSLPSDKKNIGYLPGLCRGRTLGCRVGAVQYHLMRQHALDAYSDEGAVFAMSQPTLQGKLKLVSPVCFSHRPGLFAHTLCPSRHFHPFRGRPFVQSGDVLCNRSKHQTISQISP